MANSSPSSLDRPPIPRAAQPSEGLSESREARAVRSSPLPGLILKEGSPSLNGAFCLEGSFFSLGPLVSRHAHGSIFELSPRSTHDRAYLSGRRPSPQRRIKSCPHSASLESSSAFTSGPQRAKHLNLTHISTSLQQCSHSTTTLLALAVAPLWYVAVKHTFKRL